MMILEEKESDVQLRSLDSQKDSLLELLSLSPIEQNGKKMKERKKKRLQNLQGLFSVSSTLLQVAASKDEVLGQLDNPIVTVVRNVGDLVCDVAVDVTKHMLSNLKGVECDYQTDGLIHPLLPPPAISFDHRFIAG
jgi:hypothetical protein